MEKFLGEIQNIPDTLAKKLTEVEKEANDEEISLEELRETLDDANAGKTPGTDGVDKDFLVRFWNMIGPTIYHAQKTFIGKEQLNEFLETGLIKVINPFLYYSESTVKKISGGTQWNTSFLWWEGFSISYA